MENHSGLTIYSFALKDKAGRLIELKIPAVCMNDAIRKARELLLFEHSATDPSVNFVPNGEQPY